jgi:hypothetical protein
MGIGNTVEAMQLLGEALARIDEHDEAMQWYRHAVDASDGRHWPSVNNLAGQPFLV